MDRTMDLRSTIQAANESAQKLYGRDISIVVARAPAFGNDDTLIIVSGKRHAEAARGFALSKGAQISTDTGRDFLGDGEYTYSKVLIPAAAAAAA